MQSLTQIKMLRKKFHLNQKELADKANVSQSLIAKIEAGKVEPTWSKAQRIFDALEELRGKEEVKAGEVMKIKVLFAKSHDSLKDIIKTMKIRGISQMPVREKGRIVGLISEGIILDNIDKANTAKVEEIMEDAPPIVSPKTGLKTLLELLKDHQIILVAEKGDIKGIISKTDLLGKIE